tara:strand:+ start:5441 stop:6277 length:837 start_codon:yes stop_codon:yes gene_type:complete
MKKIKLLFFLVIWFGATQAQHSTLRFTDEPINLNNQSLLVVPFEKGMYLSDVNPVIARANQMTTEEIVSRYQAAIDQSLRYTFEEKCQVSSFYLVDEEEMQTDLRYVYSKLKLEYELVSETEEKSKMQSLKERVKKEDKSYQRGRIENGQVISKRDDRKRYMKAVVKDQHMLDSMYQKFNNKYFLFINQLDVSNDYSDGVSMGQMQYNRLIQLHYTLYHKDGTVLSTGISMTSFPATVNDINVITREYFPILAKQIFEELFPPVEEQEKKKFQLNKWK